LLLFRGLRAPSAEASSRLGDMGSGLVKGVNCATAAAKDEELKDVLAGLDPESRAKLAKALEKAGGAAPAEDKAAEDKAAAGSCKVFGLPASMNAMGPILLATSTGCGEMEAIPMEQWKGSEFLAVNPFGQIPAVKDGEFSMAESNAILRYLAQKHAPELYPKGAKVRGLIDFAMDRFSSVLYKDAVAVIYPSLGFGASPSDAEAAGKACTENLEQFCEVFLKSKFVAGDSLSIADYKIAPFFIAYEHPGLQEAAKVKCPARVVQFNKDFADACKTAGMLCSAGGWAVKELLDSKTSPGEVQAGKGFEGAAVALDASEPSGKCELLGVCASMNVMGPALLLSAAGCGELKATMDKAEWKEANPFGQMPGLKDGDYRMGESSAILRYLAEAYAPDLYPEGAEKRGFIDWAIDRFVSKCYPDTVACVYPILGYAPAPADVEAAGKQCAQNMEDFAKVFLKEKFIGGDALSIADYKVAPFFFAFAHEVVKEKSKVECPERIAQFNKDFAEACKSSEMLKAAGGFAIQEVLDAKK